MPEYVDVITAFSSDGRTSAYDLVVLQDDRGAIPPYDALVLASRQLSARAPAVTAALARLDGRIDVDRMRELNSAVDERGELPGAVAEQFLRELSR